MGTSVTSAATGSFAAVANKVEVNVASISKVTVEANGPGELSGSGLGVNVVVRNTGTEPVDLSSLTVNAYAANGTPGVPSGGGKAEPLSGTLAPGAQQSGTYTFRLANADPATARVEIGMGDSSTVVEVTGR